jgi:hypothetical protein
LEKLNFRPLLADEQPATASGIARFQLEENVSGRTFKIPLSALIESPYAVAAITNHPECLVTLKENHADHFVIQIDRIHESTTAIEGLLHWFARQTPVDDIPDAIPVADTDDVADEEEKPENAYSDHHPKTVEQKEENEPDHNPLSHDPVQPILPLTISSATDIADTETAEEEKPVEEEETKTPGEEEMETQGEEEPGTGPESGTEDAQQKEPHSGE